MRRCEGPDDVLGAVYELAFAVANDLRVRRVVFPCDDADIVYKPDVVARRPARPVEPGPSLDIDGTGYYCNARRAMEDG